MTAAGSGTRPGNTNTSSGNGTGDRPSSGAGQETRGGGSRTVACEDCVEPEYPESAVEAGIEGQPLVNVEINADGSVRSVVLTRSSGNAAIDRAAIEAAQRSRFQPVEGGASVPIEYDLNIEGSERNRAARERGERRSVEIPTPTTAESAPPEPAETATDPAPEPVAPPSNDAPAPETPSATPTPETTPTPSIEEPILTSELS